MTAVQLSAGESSKGVWVAGGNVWNFIPSSKRKSSSKKYKV